MTTTLKTALVLAAALFCMNCSSSSGNNPAIATQSLLPAPLATNNGLNGDGVHIDIALTGSFANSGNAVVGYCDGNLVTVDLLSESASAIALQILNPVADALCTFTYQSNGQTSAASDPLSVPHM
jgi:hypothetical protein